MKLQIKQTIGFTIEIVAFVMTGYFMGISRQVYNFPSAICFAIAFGFAIWTGKQIKQEGREERR
jgi:hypothetical protein